MKNFGILEESNSGKTGQIFDNILAMNNLESIQITKAVASDADLIPGLLAPWVAKRIVLPRTPADILYYLENFLVARLEDKLVGVVALRNFGDGLNEIRSLAVAQGSEGAGLGTALVQAAIQLGRERQAQQIFALTLRPNLFTRIGFQVVQKELFPQKVWSDCQFCTKQDCCDEIAVRLLLP